MLKELQRLGQSVFLQCNCLVMSCGVIRRQRNAQCLMVALISKQKGRKTSLRHKSL